MAEYRDMDKINPNIILYNQVREVPKEAQKAIQGGRLKGMTDINPMWRIKTLTEQFGPAGIGWYTEIIDQWLEEGANDEVVAFMKIHLYINYEGEWSKPEWSKPIVGIGGSSFIAKEKNGLYTSDEAYKMAYTDALSISCKALGIGADIWWANDTSKYSKVEDAQPASPMKDVKTTSIPTKEDTKLASEKQLNYIYSLVKKKNYEDGIKKYIKANYNKNSSKELTVGEAKEIIDLLNSMEG